MKEKKAPSKFKRTFARISLVIIAVTFIIGTITGRSGGEDEAAAASGIESILDRQIDSLIAASAPGTAVISTGDMEEEPEGDEKELPSFNELQALTMQLEILQATSNPDTKHINSISDRLDSVRTELQKEKKALEPSGKLYTRRVNIRYPDGSKMVLYQKIRENSTNPVITDRYKYE